MRRSVYILAGLTAALLASPAAAQFATSQTTSPTVTRLPGGQTIYQTPNAGYGQSGYGQPSYSGQVNRYGRPTTIGPQVPTPTFQSPSEIANQQQQQQQQGQSTPPNVGIPGQTVDDVMTPGQVRGSSDDKDAVRAPRPTDQTTGSPTSGGQAATIAVGTKIYGGARVIDGNTLSIQNQTIMLYGADAPELDQSCNDLRGFPWRCGVKAKSLLQSLVADHSVKCVAMKTSTSAMIASCRAGGVDLSAAMIANGFAMSPKGVDQPYKRDENTAQMAKRGMWVGRFNMPWLHRTAGR